MTSATTTLVSPRAAMTLWPAAVRYSVGRLTGVYIYPLIVAAELRPSLTPQERAIVVDTATGALERTARSTRASDVADERRDWARLIDDVATDSGPGRDAPVELHGRALAISAIGALRHVLETTPAPAAFDAAAIAQSCAAVAGQFSTSDRALVLRELAEYAERADVPVAAHWVEMYARIAAMPLDESSARWHRLPDSI